MYADWVACCLEATGGTLYPLNHLAYIEDSGDIELGHLAVGDEVPLADGSTVRVLALRVPLARGGNYDA